MEKLSREARNEVEERMVALNLWEKAVIRAQSRGEEIDALLQSVEALSRRINNKRQERNEKDRCLKSVIRDASEQNKKIEKHEKLLEALREEHSNLRAKMKDVYSQEQKGANEERLRIEALVRNCKSELKNLNREISIGEEKIITQERTIYNQDYKLLQIENRLSKMQDETLSEEVRAYQEDIQSLSTESEGLSVVHRKLLTELEAIQVESKQMERAIRKLLVEKAAVDSQRDSDTAHVEQVEKALKRCKDEYSNSLVDKNMLQLKIRRTDEILRHYSEKVFNLEKSRLTMEKCVKERETDISIAMEMTVATLRLTNEENARLRKEVNFRRLQTNKLAKRYEIELLKMAHPTEGRLENQTFYVIKVVELSFGA
ncbi:unnamed protein product [Hydatigera taeniaeformis]|uniref:Coiled-coil domain-containing protein 39 n=1 Tax=Hydatigena taeniaeformis TaxID=6205 RepID=A0A0R3WPG2_HYDTA|nr:unnamed protein product [Hydatigera taeniaeformis]